MAGCSQIGVSSHQTEPDSNLALAHAYNLANGGQQSIFALCFRPNTDPNGGEWAEISVPVRRWSIETQRERIFGWPPEQKVPSSNLGSRTVLSRELRPASKGYLRKSCNSCGGETGR